MLTERIGRRMRRGLAARGRGRDVGGVHAADSGDLFQGGGDVVLDRTDEAVEEGDAVQVVRISRAW